MLTDGYAVLAMNEDNRYIVRGVFPDKYAAEHFSETYLNKDECVIILVKFSVLINLDR